MDRQIGGITLRELLGAGLLVLLLLLGLLSAWYLNRQSSAMAAALEDSTWLALSGQWENAKEMSASVRQDWEKGWRLRAAFADHANLEEIDGLFREMMIYGAADERTEFSRTCALLAEKLKAMADSARFSWWNVL